MSSIDFYWEPGSPYTYLAATQIGRLAAETGTTVNWKAFLLGKVFQARKMSLPAAIPAKASYMFKDLARWSALYDVPFRMPKVFPVNSMLASRAASAAAQQGSGEAAALALLGAYWGRGEDISQPEVVQAALDAAGLDGAALLVATQDDAVKDIVRANTEAALELGIFGAPTMVYEGALFWGNDRLDVLKAVIEGRIKV
ncbi:2-hydroxychromene-2-carboxylate isomerase [Polycyclovorans algicola]|uniref:2-hydroxychromene-2-carboxylate isomerase n=1 Tax=Polycyclovorans algicola TaxID=616992 RepID=UPI0004A6BC14|nr:2-hydroxychromene-2-carboxylate isomerase [Polycyclovorans algicola]